jgi:hypothetical protein
VSCLTTKSEEKRRKTKNVKECSPAGIEPKTCRLEVENAALKLEQLS